MGERSKDLIVINTVVPFLYTYGLHKADERMCERAARFLEELKAESNHIIRSWSDAGLPVVSAAPYAFSAHKDGEEDAETWESEDAFSFGERDFLPGRKCRRSFSRIR